jgi:hypothetical protein
MALEATNILTAEDAAIVLKYGVQGEQSAVKGLDGLGPPGLSREIVTVKEFRQAISRQFTTGGKLGNINFSGTYVKQDTKGYDQLVEYYVANTKFTDARVYLNLVDFIAPDLSQDLSAAFQVAELSKPDADSNGVYTLTGVLVLNGRPATFFAHSDFTAQDGTTLDFVQGSGGADTITDSASNFVNDGFVAGQSLIIEGSTLNDPVKTTIVTVVAGLLTLESEGDLTTEQGLEDTVLHGGKLN